LAAAQDHGKVFIIDLKVKRAICKFDDKKTDKTGREISL